MPNDTLFHIHRGLSPHRKEKVQMFLFVSLFTVVFQTPLDVWKSIGSSKTELFGIWGNSYHYNKIRESIFKHVCGSRSTVASFTDMKTEEHNNEKSENRLLFRKSHSKE